MAITFPNSRATPARVVRPEGTRVHRPRDFKISRRALDRKKQCLTAANRRPQDARRSQFPWRPPDGEQVNGKPPVIRLNAHVRPVAPQDRPIAGDVGSVGYGHRIPKTVV